MKVHGGQLDINLLLSCQGAKRNMHRKAKGENPPPAISRNQASPYHIFNKRRAENNKEQSLSQTLKEGCEQLDAASRGVND